MHRILLLRLAPYIVLLKRGGGGVARSEATLTMTFMSVSSSGACLPRIGERSAKKVQHASLVWLKTSGVAMVVVG